MAIAEQPAPRSSDALLYGKLTCVALLWGGTFVAGRFLAGELSPITAATARFGLAVVLLLMLVRRAEGGLPRLSRRQFALTLGLGATGVFLYNVFFFAALSEMPASRTALFVAFNPIAVALAMALFARERLAAHRLLGIAIALIGALVVIARGDVAALLGDFGQSFGLGEMSMFAAVASWVIYTVLGRKVLGDLSPLAATTYAAIWGFVFLLVAFLLTSSIAEIAQISWDKFAALAYLAIGGTVIPFVWYYQGVRSIGAARAAVFTNLVPVFGVALGFFLLNEAVSVSMLLGGGLVLLGVSLTNR